MYTHNAHARLHMDSRTDIRNVSDCTCVCVRVCMKNMSVSGIYGLLYLPVWWLGMSSMLYSAQCTGIHKPSGSELLPKYTCPLHSCLAKSKFSFIRPWSPGQIPSMKASQYALKNNWPTARVACLAACLAACLGVFQSRHRFWERDDLRKLNLATWHSPPGF